MIILIFLLNAKNIKYKNKANKKEVNVKNEWLSQDHHSLKEMDYGSVGVLLPQCSCIYKILSIPLRGSLDLLDYVFLVLLVYVNIMNTFPRMQRL